MVTLVKTKPVNNIRVELNSGCLRVEGHLFASRCAGGWWVIDNTIPDLDLACRAFRVFEQCSIKHCKNDEQSLRALDQGLNKSLYVGNVPVYYNGKLNKTGICSYINRKFTPVAPSDKFSIYHNAVLNHVRVWVNDEIVTDLNVTEA